VIIGITFPVEEMGRITKWAVVVVVPIV